MFKKIFPLVFAAAAAHAAPFEAVYVGEPTKRLAQEAARCAATLTFAGVLLNDGRRTAGSQFFLDFAVGAIGKDATHLAARQQIKAYEDMSLGSRDKRLQADVNACTNTVTAIRRNRGAQNLASCAATADVAKLQKLAIGGDHTKISVNLLEEASIHLGDDRHAVDILVKEFRTLTQAGPSATRAAILNCQPVFNAAIEGIRTNPTGGPAVSPTGPR